MADPGSAGGGPAARAQSGPRLYAAAQAGHPDYELTATVELARLEGRVERPHLAVWIEDKDRFPSRGT